MAATEEPEYEIEFTVKRRLPGEADTTEIGFGVSGRWSSVDQAAHIVQSAVQNREWETEAGQPDPSSVDKERF